MRTTVWRGCWSAGGFSGANSKKVPQNPGMSGHFAFPSPQLTRGPMRVGPARDGLGGADGRREPLELDRGVGGRRFGQLGRNSVDDPGDGALLPVEVQRAVLEVLHDPLRLLDLAAGRQAER